MDMQAVNWQDVFDKFLVYLAALPARAAEMQGGAAKAIVRLSVKTSSRFPRLRSDGGLPGPQFITGSRMPE